MPATRRPNLVGRHAGDPGVDAAKSALRVQLRSERQRPEAADAAQRRTAAALQICGGHRTIALYCSVADEPNTWHLIDALFADARSLLLPVLGRRPDGTARHAADWAVYSGRAALRTGFAGILEPTTTPLGADGLRAASLVWCSALAASPAGDRLGTGGGWYDRALGYAAREALVGVLLRDSEVLDEVPVDVFDRRIDVIVTESRTIRTHARRNSFPGANC